MTNSSAPSPESRPSDGGADGRSHGSARSSALTNRLSIVTLGVSDLEASLAFYERLGWARVSSSMPGQIAWFDMGGTYLGLYPRASYPAETGLEESQLAFSSPGRHAGVTLAINLGSADAVNAGLEVARGAGAEIIKEAQTAEWGGHSGYFADPDGHLWEVAYNPFSPLTADGLLDMGPAAQ